MATAASPVPFDEYMSTSYSPDCEYIDGVIVERNVGKGKHSFTQLELGSTLRDLVRPRGLIVLTEQRTRVGAYRIRIPDISVVEKLEEVTSRPPLLCVEILSPDDRWVRINASIVDYQEMGVPSVWVVDPWSRRAWIFELDKAPVEVQNGLLSAPHLGLELKLETLLPPPD